METTNNLRHPNIFALHAPHIIGSEAPPWIEKVRNPQAPPAVTIIWMAANAVEKEERHRQKPAGLECKNTQLVRSALTTCYQTTRMMVNDGECRHQKEQQQPAGLGNDL